MRIIVQIFFCKFFVFCILPPTLVKDGYCVSFCLFPIFLLFVMLQWVTFNFVGKSILDASCLIILAHDLRT